MHQLCLNESSNGQKNSFKYRLNIGYSEYIDRKNSTMDISCRKYKLRIFRKYRMSITNCKYTYPRILSQI